MGYRAGDGKACLGDDARIIEKHLTTPQAIPYGAASKSCLSIGCRWDMDRLTTGQLAGRAGVNVQTVRYYERRGRLAEPERTATRYRLYPESDLGRIRFIRRAQALGFTLSEIEELLSLRVSERTSPDDLRERVRQKVSIIDERIRELQEIRSTLAHMADACTVQALSARCPFLQTLEAQADAAALTA
jgi:MerR family transcriptional regulator, copper efflux regulator